MDDRRAERAGEEDGDGSWLLLRKRSLSGSKRNVSVKPLSLKMCSFSGEVHVPATLKPFCLK